jgi:AcrR family transcriptional regulator
MADSGTSAQLKSKRNVKAELAVFKREQIMDVAAHLFLARGYHGCSLDAVASKLGVTKPYIYYQFRDKADLLTSICEIGANLSLTAIGEAEALKANEDTRVAWFVHRLCEILLDYGHFLAVYVRETNSLPESARKAIIRKREEIDRRVCAQISAGHANRLFDVADPLVSARAITGMISFIPMWRRETDPQSRTELTAMMTDIAMRTIRKPGAT